MNIKVVYLAQPYGNDNSEIRNQRHTAAVHAAAALMGKGFVVFSPILQTHMLDEFYKITSTDFLLYDLHMLVRCDEIHMLELPGWQESSGMSVEATVARRHHIPIVNWGGDNLYRMIPQEFLDKMTETWNVYAPPAVQGSGANPVAQGSGSHTTKTHPTIPLPM